MRGMVTATITTEAERLLGIQNISNRELRLMPYIQFVMVNNQRLEPNKVTPEERGILEGWKKKGWIEGGAGGLAITEEFWEAINRLIWLGYVVGGSE